MVKKRILMLSTCMGLGGADQQILYLVRTLLKRGYEIQIVSMTPLGAMGKEAQSEGLPIQSLNMKRGVPDPKAIFKLARILHQLQPDILHSHMVHANFLARVSRLFSNVPVLVCTAHNINEGNRWREVIYYLTDSLCEITTQVSQAGAERYVNIKAVPTTKNRVIPNGIDIQKFKPNLEAKQRLRHELSLERQFIGLAVGRFRPPKDYPNLLQAFSRIKVNSINTVLIIVGEGSLKPEMKALGKTIGIHEQVKFLEPRRDIPDLMNIADVYVMSSAWEGMPMVLLEAASVGLPIVATDVGGNREIVLDGKNGFLVPPRHPDALAQALERMMNLSPQERQQMGQFSRKHVELNYSIERVVDRWEELYQQLLDKTSSQDKGV
ncbi:glycosyltransferase [Coleofasciculus sp.]|uniref:glycosyltransferase n=1 Tax=Coleofasciculus sp. TaxID=3100458 RepID=UPI0039FA1425